MVKSQHIVDRKSYREAVAALKKLYSASAKNHYRFKRDKTGQVIKTLDPAQKLTEEMWVSLLRWVGDYDKVDKGNTLRKKNYDESVDPAPEKSVNRKLADILRNPPKDPKSLQTPSSPGRIQVRSVMRTFLYARPSYLALDKAKLVCDQSGAELMNEQLAFAIFDVTAKGWERRDEIIRVPLYELLVMSGSELAIREYARWGTITPEVLGAIFNSQKWRKVFSDAWFEVTKTRPFLSCMVDGADTTKLVPYKLRNRDTATTPNWQARYKHKEVLDTARWISITKIKMYMADDFRELNEALCDEDARSFLRSQLEPIDCLPILEKNTQALNKKQLAQLCHMLRDCEQSFCDWEDVKAVSKWKDRVPLFKLNHSSIWDKDDD